VSSAVVIGNGESRRSIDIESLKINNVLIGCNAVHRDTVVDHLVCCDRRMVDEAVDNPMTEHTEIYVREDWFKYYRKTQKRKNIIAVPDLPYQGDQRPDRPEHWGSGGYALLVAAQLGFDTISLVGFDLYSKNNKVNNVYKDTQNYSASDKQAVDYSYWVYQISKVFQHFPNINFIVINETDWLMPKEWQQSNVQFNNIEQIIC
jgi:hypothetical protein